MPRLAVLFFTWLICLGAIPAQAVTCAPVEHDGNRYSVCEASADEDIRLFLNDDKGRLLGHFGAVDNTLDAENAHLSFAMNAGMYHDDRRPVGLYIENGAEVARLITGAGPGNFGLVPNGVFCVAEDRADVVETLAFKRNPLPCRFATQSGPMLVIDGALHPRFLPDSTSRYIRNGVGTSRDGKRIVFAKSENAVTFHEFGLLFRDALNIPQALYLDGNISRLYAPALNRADAGFAMGPIIGVVVPD